MGSIDQRRGAGIRLQMTSTATRAYPRIDRPINRNVTDFAPKTICAFDQEIVDNDSTPHASTECKQDQAGMFATGSNPEFTISRRIRVVCKSDGQFECLTHGIADREVPPTGQIGWLKDHPVGNVHCTGSSKSSGSDLIKRYSRLPNDCLQMRVGLFDSVLRAEVLACGESGLSDDSATVVYHPQLDIGSTDIDADKQRWFERLGFGIRHRNRCSCFFNAHEKGLNGLDEYR